MKQFFNGLFFVVILMMAIDTQAQTFVVQPYLQDATPNSIRIMWETSAGEESVVMWGLEETLGIYTIGTSFSSVGSAMMHEVEITGLERFTTYYYRAVTGQASSQIQSFKTPPFASDEQSFRFVAMSDMQKSSADPLKYDEVIHDGVLDYLEQNLTGVASEDLALVLIPGDLVDS
ncbi:MAG: fibronectin type III domain-containing protein, partial [Flavobacteriales bacterium]|nr:fibronectin type III domain-containing protein [Flavobacteriales bacterium]